MAFAQEQLSDLSPVVHAAVASYQCVVWCTEQDAFALKLLKVAWHVID